MNTLEQSKKTIDLNKHKDNLKYSWAKNQEEQIELILIREFNNNKEYDINAIPRINIKDLSILGYKNPQKAVKTLINRGVVKQLNDDIIELITDQVYCNQCRTRPVFVWDKVNHLEKFHYWSNNTKIHNVLDTEFSNKPLPDMIDHDYKIIGELKDNQIEVKCKNCGYERTIYIDYRRECDPFDKSIFIDNPQDQKDIKVKVGRNDDIIILKNQEELQKFIDNQVNGA